MSMAQWESVLVAWVNCLKLYKPIQNLTELRNGEFFRNLRKLIRKTPDPMPNDDLTVIFQLLSQHYPNIQFTDPDSIHINDIPHSDFVHMTSLLMHYTCIYDRRNALTSPMCYSLDMHTQLHIKKFLERVSSETSSGELDSIIANIFFQEKSPVTVLVNTPLSKKSPLQELLKTPSTKAMRMIEKRREVERLKLQLESEKCDRTECERELKEQLEKTRNLEELLRQKTSEVKQLNSELKQLKEESDISPKPQEIDPWEVSRLRMEIQDLENYVQKCHSEQEELQKDRDTIREKLKALESDSMRWQQNYFESEEKFQEAIETSKDFELKNHTLEEQCKELLAMLDEYRCKSSNLDDSNFMDISNRHQRRSGGFDPQLANESLAISVVDMQLKEALKNMENLDQELKVTKQELERCIECNMRLENEKKTLQQQLVEVNEISKGKSEKVESLQREVSEVLKELQFVKDKNIDLEKMLEKFNEESIKLREQLASECSARIKIDEELNRTEERLKACEFQFTQQRAQLESINITLEERNKTITEKLQCTETLYEKLEKTHKVLLSQLDQAAVNHKNMEAQLLDLENEKQALTKSLEEAQFENDKLTNNIAKLTQSFEDSQKHLKFVEAALDASNLKLTEESNCRAKLEEANLAIKAERDFIAEALKNNEHRCQELQLMHEDLKTQLEEASVREIELEKEVSVITKRFGESEKLLKQLEDSLKNSELKLSQELENKAQLEAVNLNLMEEKKDLTETLTKKKQLYENLQETHKSLLTDLEEATARQTELERQLSIFEDTEKHLKSDMKQVSEALHGSELKLTEEVKRRIQLEAAYSNLKEESENREQQMREDLRVVKEDLKASELKLTEEYNYRAKLEEANLAVKGERDSIAEALKNSEHHCQELHLMHEDLKNQLEEASLRQIELEKEVSVITERFRETEKLLKQLEDSLKSSELKLSQELDNKAQLEAVNFNLMEEKNDLTETLKNNKQLYESLQATHKSLLADLEEGTARETELEKQLSILEDTEEHLKSEIKQVREALQGSELKLGEEVKKRTQLEAAYSSLKEETEEREQQMQEDLRVLKEELEASELKLTEESEFRAQLETVNLMLKENLDAKAQVIESTENAFDKLQKEHRTLSIQLEEVKENRIQLERQLSEAVHTFEATEKELRKALDISEVKLLEEARKRAQLEDAYKILKEEKRTDSEALRDSEKQRVKLQGAILELKNQNDITAATINNSEKLWREERKALEENLEVLKAELRDEINLKTTFENTASNLEETVRDLSSQLDDLKKSNQSLAEQLETALQQGLAADEEKTKLLVSLEDISTQLQGSKKEVQNLQIQLASTSKLLNEALSSKSTLEAELLQSASERENLKVQLAMNQDQLEKTSVQIDTLETTAQKAEIEVERLLEVKALIETNLADSSRKMVEAEVALEKALEEVKSVKFEKETINFYLKDTSKQLEEAESRVEIANGKLKATAKRLKEVEKDNLQKAKEANAEIEIVKTENKALEARVEVLTANLQEVKQELKATLDDKETADVKFNEALDLLEKTKESKEICEAKLKLTIAEKDSLHATLLEVTSRHDETCNSLKEITTKYEEICWELSKTLKDKESLKLEAQEGQRAKEEVKALRKELLITEQKLNQAVEETQSKIRQLQSDLETKNQELETQKVHAEHQLKEQYSTSCQEKNDLYAKLEDALSKLQLSEEQFEANIKKSNVQVQSLEGENSHFARLIDDLTKKVEEANDSHSLNLKTAEEERAILVKTLDETVNQLEVFEEKLQRAEHELQKAQEATRLVQNFLDLSQAEVFKLSLERDHLVEALEMSNKDQAELQLKLEELHQVVDEGDFEKKELMQQKTEVLESLQKIIKEKKELFTQLELVSAQLEETRREGRKLQQGHNDNESEIKKLQLENSELGEQLEKVKRDHKEALSHLEVVEKERRILEDGQQKLLLEKEDLSKEKNEIYDFLQRSVEEKEKVLVDRERLTSENDVLVKERDTMFVKLQAAAEENHKLQLALELSQTETLKIKKERNEIMQSHIEIMKETESNIRRVVEEKRVLMGNLQSAEEERDKVRQAYATVVSANSKLELENSCLRQQLEDGRDIKEAYEKLLEDNCKRLQEIEVLRQKRNKDREEFLSILKREQEKAKKVETIRNDYEDKLAKMKDKMLKLYRDEVQKEIARVKGDQAGEVMYLQKANNDLRNELYEAEQKARQWEAERQGTRGRGNKVADRDIVMGSSGSLATRDGCANEREQLQKVRSVSQLYGRESAASTRDRKLSTLPPRLHAEEAVPMTRTASINSIGQNLEMEDEEDDMFNNKYLAELKEGRCQPPFGRESHSNRMSELAWRNSMVPPHLKSCYPAEVQFVSPSRFKEDDIKSGNIELDDSQCRLLPGEKPRPKKDFGTTSYKKPGPPTPSKNGGRQSLQGNELQPLREQNAPSPKKSTPGRIRALFKGLKDGGGSSRENVENITPRTSKRLSIFKNRR